MKVRERIKHKIKRIRKKNRIKEETVQVREMIIENLPQKKRLIHRVFKKKEEQK